jgi:hypothetical protein
VATIFATIAPRRKSYRDIHAVDSSQSGEAKGFKSRAIVGAGVTAPARPEKVVTGVERRATFLTGSWRGFAMIVTA